MVESREPLKELREDEAGFDAQNRDSWAKRRGFGAASLLLSAALRFIAGLVNALAGSKCPFLPACDSRWSARVWLGRKRIRGGVLNENGGFMRCRRSLRGRKLRFESLMVITDGKW